MFLKKGILGFIIFFGVLCTHSLAVSAEEDIELDVEKERLEFLEMMEEVEKENEESGRDINIFEELSDQDYINLLPEFEKIELENLELSEEELDELAYDVIVDYYNKNYKEQKSQDNIITPLYISVGGANSKEVKLCANHPIACSKVKDDAKKAKNATLVFYSSGLHNGNGDAFRHALWNRLMVSSVGTNLAKKFADAHEFGAKNQPKLEEEMDLHNNKLGRSLSSSHTNTVLSAINSGKGKRIVNGKLVKTNRSGLKK